MREQVIEFLVCNTSYTYQELSSWTDQELDNFMGRTFSIEY